MNLFGEPEFVEIKRIDPAYEIFRAMFDLYMKPAKYGKTKGDFEQLSRLRRTMELKPLSVPPQWEKACQNYFASPLGAYSLKDLAARYAVFVKWPLDRFNKPVGGFTQPNHRSGPTDDSAMYLALRGKPQNWEAIAHDDVQKLVDKGRKGKHE